MAFFKIIGWRYPGDKTQSYYVQADDAVAAVQTAELNGLTVNGCAPTDLESIPESERILQAPDNPPPPDAITRLARSPLAVRPIQTIALGVGFGIVLGFVILMLIAYLLGGELAVG
ncbi:MAG: hypothetical protein RIB32_01935 [Phycisphaerales bacterium]